MKGNKICRVRHAKEKIAVAIADEGREVPYYWGRQRPRD